MVCFSYFFVFADAGRWCWCWLVVLHRVCLCVFPEAGCLWSLFTLVYTREEKQEEEEDCD